MEQNAKLVKPRSSRCCAPRQLREWVASLETPVGLMAAYDHRALHVLEACREIGVCVPEEVAVISVDNDEQICELAMLRTKFGDGLVVSPDKVDLLATNPGAAAKAHRGHVHADDHFGDTGIVDVGKDAVTAPAS